MSLLDSNNSPTPNGLTLPLLPLRDIVIFPHMVAPLFVGRPQSIAALEAAEKADKKIFLTTQLNPQTESPCFEELYPLGVCGKIVQMLKLPDGTVKVLIEGVERARLNNLRDDGALLLAEIELLEDEPASLIEANSVMRAVRNSFDNYIGLSKKIPAEVSVTSAAITEPSMFADTVSAHLQIPISDRQELLEQLDVALRLEKLLEMLEQEIEILQIEGRIRSRVKTQMERSQKEYYLNEQMRAIQQELGDKDEFKQELAEIEEQIEKKKMSSEATDKARQELRKLRLMSPMSAEATVVRNYIEWLLSLPWKKGTRDQHDLIKAEAVLEADHYGLEKVKERVIEYLAVQALVKQIKGPILCLVGPPGVGKTSLGQSIAKALGRKFQRISLGGVRDEAEIRGHRRTYIGAMPGKIIQGLRKVGVKNPVFMLDEIDKMSTDFRGDPSSALLEVLDPEQNHTFGDHFLDIDYDLSQVLFIATANNLHSIPRALHDRLEIINIEGYTEEEKLNISKRYLLDKQIAAHGLSRSNVSFSEAALLEIIRRYTKESGVRALDRSLASVCRKLARRSALEDKISFKVGTKQIEKFLGVPPYSYGIQEESDAIGVATGLAWTEVGGELLNIEVSLMPGSGKLTLTGKLGDVMQESAQAAFSYVRSRWKALDLEEDFHTKIDVHIHVPEGAVPKDGPSAGITIATALASALTGLAVRCDLAMTGEVTLRGRVLPIGGLKEKLLAARRAGIGTVLIPEANRRNLVDIPEPLRNALILQPVADMDKVLDLALVKNLKKK
ncbi:endopeptidase La [Geopsychrobacter electrodiphilus]|uniref:endopeptidase La n=1 Tax=Geopsychrobacter electrodiphilus TaxID=225196 RepID=UPI0003A0A030|nr:endopeptidase La [Geopsychrobacter electrodiphilus]